MLFALAVIVFFQLKVPSSSGEGNSSAQWSTPDDIKDGTYVFVSGSAYEKAFVASHPEAKLVHVTNWSDEAMQVVQGKSDALLKEASSIPSLMEKYPSLAPMDEVVTYLECSFGAAKTPLGKKVAAEFDVFLDKLRKEGELDKLYAKWEDPDTAPDRIEDFPKTGESQGTLRVATTLDWPPVCYLNGSNPCGYFIEVLMRFCAEAGYEPVLENVEFEPAMLGLSTGKYDLYAYGLESTEEGEENVNFTSVFFSEPVYLVVRKDRLLGYEEEQVDSSLSERASNLISSMVGSFEKNFIRENRWRMILSGLLVTIGLSILSPLLGTILGALLCAMRLSRSVWLNAASRLYIRILQGTPIVMLLMILYYIVFGKSNFPAFWVCVLGFGLDFSAYAAEIFRSGIESVPAGQRRAAMALGFSPRNAFLQVVLPQAIRYIVPVYIGQLISTVKLTSVAGYISVEDLSRISDLIRARTYEAFFPLVITAIIYFLVASLLTLVLKIAQRQTDPRYRLKREGGKKNDAK